MKSLPAPPAEGEAGHGEPLTSRVSNSTMPTVTEAVRGFSKAPGKVTVMVTPVAGPSTTASGATVSAFSVSEARAVGAPVAASVRVKTLRSSKVRSCEVPSSNKTATVRSDTVGTLKGARLAPSPSRVILSFDAEMVALSGAGMSSISTPGPLAAWAPHTGHSAARYGPQSEPAPICTSSAAGAVKASEFRAAAPSSVKLASSVTSSQVPSPKSAYDATEAVWSSAVRELRSCSPGVTTASSATAVAGEGGPQSAPVKTTVLSSRTLTAAACTESASVSPKVGGLASSANGSAAEMPARPGARPSATAPDTATTPGALDSKVTRSVASTTTWSSPVLKVASAVSRAFW